MCTLALAFQQHDGYPLVIAANRDEALDRPSRGPFIWPQRFLAPRDERAFGTWLGLTKSGMFVGITNRFSGPRDANRTSRGALVATALEAPSAKALHAKLQPLDARAYNGFHLMYADATDAFVSWGDGETLHQQPLSPGLHVVTERSFGGVEPRADLVREGWPKTPTPDTLMALLRLQGAHSPLDGTYVYAPDFNYGTKSSLVLLFAADPSKRRLFWAEGNPPQPPPFTDESALLKTLGL